MKSDQSYPQEPKNLKKGGVAIRLKINGDLHSTSATHITELLNELGLPSPLMLVEYNGIALIRSEWPEIVLSEGDTLELMAVAAGG